MRDRGGVMKRLISFCVIVFFGTLTISAEKVGKYYYKGFPERLQARTIKLPQDMVAHAEKVMAFDSSSSFSSGGAASVMLVIDHSTSMFLKLPDNSPPGPFDPTGIRFSVANKIVDEIYAKSPDSKIGLSIYSSHFYFDKKDDALFHELDVYKEYAGIKGAFVPLLKLNEVVTVGKYAGKIGRDVLKEYLKTKDTTVTYQSNTNNFKKDRKSVV